MERQQIRRIIFFSETSFSQRDYHRWGFDILRKNGFQVEAWDMASVIYPGLDIKYTPPDELFCSERKLFINKKDIIHKICHLTSQDFVIVMIPYQLNTWSLFRALTISPADYAVIKHSMVPSALVDFCQQRALADFLKLLKKSIFYKIASKIFERIPFAMIGIKSARFVFLGGETSDRSFTLIDKRTEKVWAHAFDYDIYLSTLQTKENSSEPIAVFLDEYEPFHPDHLFANTKNVISPEVYYPALNKFFDQVERELNMSVIVAAHPRSRYEDNPGIYAGRPWIRGKTADLVKNAKLVLAHASCSLSFAILYSKPIIFLNFRFFDGNFMGHHIRATSKFLDKKSIYIDAPFRVDWEKEMVVNLNRYRMYRKWFVKKDGSPNEYFWQIFADRLKNNSFTS